MLRSAFATFLGAAFGAVAIVPMRERIADQLLQAPEAYSVLAVAILAGLLALLIMACRESATSASSCSDGYSYGPRLPSPRPVARDAGGRFTRR